MENTAADVRNFTKSKVLWLLDDRFSDGMWQNSHELWYAIPDIARLSHVNQDSLYVLTARWCEWGYIRRIKVPGNLMNDGRPHWMHALDSKGRSYLKKLPNWYARFNDVVKNFDDPNISPVIVPRGIIWLDRDGREKYNILLWPFQNEFDLSISWSGQTDVDNAFKVDNAFQALNMAKQLYNIAPSKALQQAALRT